MTNLTGKEQSEKKTPRGSYLSTDYPYPYNLLADINRISEKYEQDIMRKAAKASGSPVLPDEPPEDERLPEDIEGSVEYVLFTLSERTREILHYRYRDKMTWEAIGRIYNVTRERIRQVNEKGLRYLNHPSRLNYLEYGIKGMTARSAEKAKAAAVEEYIRNGADVEKIKREPLLKTSIECMEIGVRAYNCLKREGCDTAEDVYNLGINIWNVRNLGRKSTAEVIRWFENNGFDIKRFRIDLFALSKSDKIENKLFNNETEVN